MCHGGAGYTISKLTRGKAVIGIYTATRTGSIYIAGAQGQATSVAISIYPIPGIMSARGSLMSAGAVGGTDAAMLEFGGMQPRREHRRLQTHQRVRKPTRLHLRLWLPAHLQE